MNALISHFLSTPLLMIRVVLQQWDYQLCSAPVVCEVSAAGQCYVSTAASTHYTLHCCGLLTAASISPPPLCWHGTERGWWGQMATLVVVTFLNLSLQPFFLLTALRFSTVCIQRRQEEDWRQIVFVYTELLKLSKTTLTFFWLVEICLQKI